MISSETLIMLILKQNNRNARDVYVLRLYNTMQYYVRKSLLILTYCRNT